MPHRRQGSSGLRTRGTRKAAYKRSVPGGRRTLGSGTRGTSSTGASPMAAAMAGTAQPRTTTPRSAMEAQSGERASLRSPRSTSRRRRRRGYNFTRNIGL